MFRHFVLVILLVEAFADEDLTTESTLAHVKVYSLEDMHHDDHHNHRPHDVHLGDVREHKKQSKVERIVSEFYNPDYIEPITVLDYRYLKTGGRDYTRGPGGQILILPKGVRINEKKEFENYDVMLDYLREKQLAEHEAHRVNMPHQGHVHHKHHIQIHGGHHHHNDHHHHDNDHDHHDHDHHGHDHHDHDHHDHQYYNHRSQHGASMYGGHKRYAEDYIQKTDDKSVEGKKEHEEPEK